jgi:hypothetical protein
VEREKEACFFWTGVNGSCQRGDKCRFAHPRPLQYTQGGPQPARRCHQFQRTGQCSRQPCMFSHESGHGQAPSRDAPTGPCTEFLSTGQCTQHQCNFSHYNPQQTRQTYQAPARDKLCHQFQVAGTCSFGNNCRFSHQVPSNAPMGLLAVQPLQAGRARELCHQFQAAGNCSFGSNCRFSHQAPSFMGPPSMQPLQAGGRARQAQQPRQAGICWKFKATRGCEFGAGCKFAASHV